MSNSDPLISEAIACGSMYAQTLANDVIRDSLTPEQIDRRINQESSAFGQWLGTKGFDESQQSAARSVFQTRVSAEIQMVVFLLETTMGNA
ncbi:hypothetical protein [Agrobacterium leguminum]|uniref:hypothetical protein n=1 Tax=Agrobacterium leguminum TaxID=2792015 RepID=UPI003CE587BF